MVALTVAGQLVALLCVLLVGFVLRKLGILDAHITRGISGLLVKAGMPAVVLYSMQQPYSPQRLKDLGIVCIGMAVMTAVSIAMAFLLCKIRRVQLRESGAWISCVAFTNAVFMARPLIIHLYGEEAAFACTAVIFAFNILTFSLGVFLMNLGGKERTSLPRLFAACLKNVAILACGVGFVLFVASISLPDPLLSAVKMLTDITTPLSMLIIGSLLAQSKLKDLVGDGRIYLLTAARLVAAPLISLLLLRYIITDPTLLGVVVLAAAMPTATTVAVFGEQYGNNALLCSKTVFVSTLLCVVTVPLVTWLMTVLYTPIG